MSNFGFDPELFVVRKGSRLASSVHLMGVTDNFASAQGTDDGRGDGVAGDPSGYGEIFFKTDGFAVELNAKTGHSCRDFFIPWTAAALRAFYREYGNEWRLSAVPVMQLTRESISGDVPHGVNEFGCLPDMDAYTLAEKTPPRDSYHNNVRYTGGHLHKSLGYSFHNLSASDKLMMAGATAIQFDLRIGIPLVAMLGKTNDHGEAVRRTYYGQAGSFRVKDYGMEYRVPSSAIMLSPILFAWVLGIMKRQPPTFYFKKAEEVKLAVQAMHKEHDFDRMRHIINNHDVEEARKFVYEHRDAVLPYLPEFYDLMVNADLAEEPLNTNLFEAWDLDGEILNHGYMGVHKLMNGKVTYAKTVFPVRPNELSKTAKGWDLE